MSLTLAALFEPLNGFFVDKFGATPTGSIVFRLDKVGSVLSDADFTDPAHPEAGIIPGLAVEKFSDLVNRVPVDVGDDRSVMLSQRSIDDTFFYNLLSPSVPRSPDGVAQDEAEALKSAFTAAKAEAVRRYSTTTLTSLSGLMLQFKPSTAEPKNWYDPAAPVWTQFEFDAAAPPDESPHDDAGVWTLQPDSALLKKVAPEIMVPVPQPFPRERPDRAQADLERRIADGRFRAVIPREELDPRVEGLHAVVAGRGDVLARVGVEAIAPRLNRPVFGFAGPAVRGEIPLVRSSLTTVERSTASDRFRKLSVRDRLRLGAEIVEQVPVKAASTPKAHISFDYCVVTISRPWLMSAFLTNRYWGIPGLAAGGFTGAQDGLWAVPAAVVVIRNLVVTADWDAADVARSQEAMSFGPFKIDSGIVDNSLRSPGLQTIGWLLDVLPQLPPQ